MSDKFSAGLEAALKTIDRPGAFAVSGGAPAFLPGLEVDGLGTIALPLTSQQARKLAALCEQAPYGKGEETLVDTGVRRVWRLKPEKFKLTSPDWGPFLETTIAAVKDELGLQDQKLEGHLYELLLYEKGGFFLPHRDGEKVDRMVATLVIVLPSSFEGGELIVRHEGEEKVIDHAPDGPRRIQYAAFYCDCEHELRPLKKGHRLCLVYNLSLAKSKKRLTAPTSSGAIEAATRVLSEWAASEGAGKLVVPLGHQYTEAGVSWDTLKGTDRPRANALVEAAKRSGCRAYLALLTFHESGSAEYVGGGGRRRRGRWDDYEDEDGEAEDYEMGEIYDSSLEATHWSAPDGERFPLSRVDIEVEEIVGGEEALKDITPDVEFEGYTGNAGMTLDHWYRHAAIILWPERLHFDMIGNAGSRSAAEVLAGMSDRWVAAGKPEEGRAELHQFAAALLRTWAPVGYWRGEGDEPDPSALFRALAALGDPALVRTYFADVLPKDGWSGPGNHFVPACEAQGWNEFRAELEAAMAATNEATLQRNVRLVEAACEAKLKKKDTGLADLRAKMAGRVVAAVKELDRANPEVPVWQRERAWPPSADLLARLARGLSVSGQEALLADLVAHAFSLPGKYPLVQVHLAALEQLRPWLAKQKAFNAGLAAWVDGCESRLTELTREMPQPPADQRRPSAVSCKCADCRELSKFLDDPAEMEHRFQIIQQRRRHLEDQIRKDGCDVNKATDRRRSPHTLVCTKNTASYQAALKKYHEDVKRLEEVRSLRPGPSGKRK